MALAGGSGVADGARDNMNKTATTAITTMDIPIILSKIKHPLA